MVLAGLIVTGDPWLTRSLTLIRIGEIRANFTSGLQTSNQGIYLTPSLHHLPRLRGHMSSEDGNHHSKDTTQNLGQIWFSGDYG